MNLANQWEIDPLTSKHRWEDNIKTNLKVTGCECEERVYLSHDKVQWFEEPSVSRKVANIFEQMRNYQPFMNFAPSSL
jgi:hypothetical protein